MPSRVCAEPRCPELVTALGRCQAHACERNRETHRNTHIYNSAKHRNTRRRQMFDQPLCVQCGAIATDLDHIVPIEQGGAIWDRSNHQSLCRSCHSAKTSAEVRARGRI